LLENPTKIQHFVSQVEQRLNGIPPDRNRIYKFEVIHRENSIIKLAHKKGVSIRANLAIEHLFSFDKSGSLAKSFENLFQRYEERMSTAVNKLKEGLDQKSNNLIGTALYEIWLLKFLNIWRNPYGVKKFLNTFYMLYSYPPPTDRYFLKCYQDIDNLKTNDLFKGFSDLGLSLKEYKKWLRGLLLLLMPNAETSAAQGNPFNNIFERIAYDLLTNKTTFRFIKLHVLSEGFPGRFLLNDRSYFYSTEPSNKDQLILNFNITDRIAMTYMITTPDIQNVVRNDPALSRFINQFGRKLGEEFIRASQTEIAQDIQLKLIRDDYQEVEKFNRGMILQAKRYVFCSQKNVIGAIIKY
jgi:hypothetical protein